MKDKIVEDLKKEFDIRSCVGIDNLKEELMDAALYIQKLQSNDR